MYSRHAINYDIRTSNIIENKCIPYIFPNKFDEERLNKKKLERIARPSNPTTIANRSALSVTLMFELIIPQRYASKKCAFEMQDEIMNCIVSHIYIYIYMCAWRSYKVFIRRYTIKQVNFMLKNNISQWNTIWICEIFFFKSPCRNFRHIFHSAKISKAKSPFDEKKNSEKASFSLKSV